MKDGSVGHVGQIQFRGPIRAADPPFHCNIPYVREVFAGAEYFDGCDVHVAVHRVMPPHSDRRYAETHRHDVDEVNLIISTDDGNPLTYALSTGDEACEIAGPAAVYIPAGTMHSAQAIGGVGLFICIVRKGRLP